MFKKKKKKSEILKISNQYKDILNILINNLDSKSLN